jgi:hypothetical protein
MTGGFGGGEGGGYAQREGGLWRRAMATTAVEARYMYPASGPR